MTELQRYLAEEVVEDHVDGITTRREALRRLGLLGVSGSAAVGLLAANAGRRQPAPCARRRARRLRRPRHARQRDARGRSQGAGHRGPRAPDGEATYSEADHAFFNDTGARFNAPAAEQAWHDVLAWFGKHVE